MSLIDREKLLEEFEKWYVTKYGSTEALKKAANNPYLADGEYLYERTKDRLSVWQSVKADSEHEIANLQANIAAQEKLGYELQASNNRLRDNFNDLEFIVARGRSPSCQKSIIDKCKCTTCVIDRFNSSAPAQSLANHDDEVIERCALVAWDYREDAVAEAIRALKGK